MNELRMLRYLGYLCVMEATKVYFYFDEDLRTPQNMNVQQSVTYKYRFQGEEIRKKELEL